MQFCRFETSKTSLFCPLVGECRFEHQNDVPTPVGLYSTVRLQLALICAMFVACFWGPHIGAIARGKITPQGMSQTWMGVSLGVRLHGGNGKMQFSGRRLRSFSLFRNTSTCQRTAHAVSVADLHRCMMGCTNMQ